MNLIMDSLRRMGQGAVKIFLLLQQNSKQGDNCASGLSKHRLCNASLPLQTFRIPPEWVSLSERSFLSLLIEHCRSIPGPHTAENYSWARNCSPPRHSITPPELSAAEHVSDDRCNDTLVLYLTIRVARHLSCFRKLAMKEGMGSLRKITILQSQAIRHSEQNIV